MPDMQFCAGRIGEHFKNIIFYVDVLFVEIILFGLFPTLLPFAFNGFHIHNQKTSAAQTSLIFSLQIVCKRDTITVL